MGIALLMFQAVALSEQMESKPAPIQEAQQAQQQNAEALRQYTWKSRTEIRKGGDIKNVRLALVRYDRYGALQKTQISSTPQQQLPTRGLRGLIAQKKKEDFIETLDGLAAVAEAYAEIPADAMRRFLSTASFTPEFGSTQKLLRISGSNVLKPGDSMTLWIDATTRNQRRVEIRTNLDRKPVRIVSEFADLSAGPTYMAHSVVDYPAEGVTLITENFDYERAR